MKTRSEKLAIIKEALVEDTKFFEIQSAMFRIEERMADLESVRYKLHRDLSDLLIKISKLCVELEEKNE